jgi:hypothetical protein
MDHASKLALIEAVKPDIAPLSDQVHTLMLEGISKVADQWIEQLKILRTNADTLEAQIITCVAKTKSDITALHDLGMKVSEEARRGQEVCRQLSDSIEKIAG